MKRSFVYLVLALMLSLLLCACGDTTNHGKVTASPWPEVTTPILPTPTPTPIVSAAPTPEMNRGDNTTGTNTDGTTGSGTAGMSTASPDPFEPNP